MYLLENDHWARWMHYFSPAENYLTKMWVLRALGCSCGAGKVNECFTKKHHINGVYLSIILNIKSIRLPLLSGWIKISS